MDSAPHATLGKPGRLTIRVPVFTPDGDRALSFTMIDFSTATGADIPIEERGGDEVAGFATCRAAPTGVATWNPAFDATPATLIDAIVTERGVVERPNRQALAALR